MTNQMSHADGTLCMAGTQSVPYNFSPCCDVFEAHTKTCSHDIRYEWWPKMNNWFIAIDPSAGGGGIAMNFCPHCGARLVV